jgi:hypothetical protein
MGLTHLRPAETLDDLMTDADELASPLPAPSRDELVAMVARAHGDAPYQESRLAGQALAAQSKLPKIVAENLGAGFGQWDFFPEASSVVDFATAYVPPSSEEEIWAMARAWAADDAAGRPTILALVGREILTHELRRIDVASLRALLDEARPSRARELRVSLGLAVPAAPPGAAGTPKSRSAGSSPRSRRAAPAGAPDIPLRMPRPELKPRPPPPPEAPARRFHHPKFGEGVLESQDGSGEEAKVTIKFAGGTKTLLARYVTELGS